MQKSHLLILSSLVQYMKHMYIEQTHRVTINVKRHQNISNICFNKLASQRKITETYNIG